MAVFNVRIASSGYVVKNVGVTPYQANVPINSVSVSIDAALLSPSIAGSPVIVPTNGYTVTGYLVDNYTTG